MDYVETLNVFQNADQYKFLDSDVVDVFKQQPGQDITKPLNNVLSTKDASLASANVNCMKNMFLVGKKDFRKTARCQAQNIILLVFSVILVTTIAAKCTFDFTHFFTEFL